jgi:integrase
MFATQKAAKDWLAQTIVDVKKGIHTPTTNAATTVAQAGEEWVEEAEIDGLERSTTESYRRQLRLHIVPYIGRLKLAELQPAHIQKLRNDLSKAGVSTAMIKRAVFSLGALLACAMSNNKVGRNVVRDATSTRPAASAAA